METRWARGKQMDSQSRNRWAMETGLRRHLHRRHRHLHRRHHRHHRRVQATGWGRRLLAEVESNLL
jgi:hypothetical protein